MYFNLSMFTSSWQKNLVVNYFLIFFTDLIAVWLHINSIKSNRITNLLPPSHRSLRNLRCIMTLHPSPRLRGFPSPNYSQWRIHRKSLHRMLSSRLNRHLMRDISIRTLYLLWHPRQVRSKAEHQSWKMLGGRETRGRNFSSPLWVKLRALQWKLRFWRAWNWNSNDLFPTNSSFKSGAWEEKLAKFQPRVSICHTIAYIHSCCLWERQPRRKQIKRHCLLKYKREQKIPPIKRITILSNYNMA